MNPPPPPPLPERPAPACPIHKAAMVLREIRASREWFRCATPRCSCEIDRPERPADL